MTADVARKERYIVSVSEGHDANNALVFAFAPSGLVQEREPSVAPTRVKKFIVSVRNEGRGLVFDWSATQDDPGTERAQIESEIAARMGDRTTWINRVTSLVGQVELWARDMGWSTRHVEKKLDDIRIGKHTVPALLMQQDTARVLLEPVGRSTPGADGVVDLYLLPAYDDIATLYYYSNRWNLHYAFPGTKPTATVREADAVPLSKETLEKVLVELKRHAA